MIVLSFGFGEELCRGDPSRNDGSRRETVVTLESRIAVSAEELADEADAVNFFYLVRRRQ